MTKGQRDFYVDFAFGFRNAVEEDTAQGMELIENILKGINTYKRILKKTNNVLNLFPGIKAEETEGGEDAEI